MSRRPRRAPQTLPAPDATPSGTERAASSRSAWFAAALLLLAAVVAFHNSLGGQFFYDDEEAIVRNPHIRSLSPLSAALQSPPQSAVAGRPIISLTLALNYAWGELDPWGYHLLNLIVHLVASLLLLGVVRRTLRHSRMPTAVRSAADGLALAGAALWLVHPLQTEVVNYTIQRTESVMGVLYLLTLYAAIRGMQRREQGQGWFGVSVAACVAGAACKESIVTAPLMVGLYDVVFDSGSLRNAFRRRGWYYGTLLGSWALLLWLNLEGPRFRSAGFDSGVSAWTYLLNQGPIIATYLARTLWPDPLVADYGRTMPIPLASAMPFLLLIGGLVAATVASWWRDRRVAYALTWFFITLAPASSIVPIATEVGAERRMYLPLASLVVLGVLSVWFGARRLAPRAGERMAFAVLGLLCVAATLVSLRRNADYHDRLVLWQTVVEARPHGRAQYNLAVEMASRGRNAEAIALYQQAAASAPEAHYGLCFMLSEAGRPGEAAVECRRFLDQLPQDALAPKASNLLGILLERLGDHAGALAAFRQTLAMMPEDAEALAGVADALRGSARFDEAADAYRRYLARVPANPVAHGNLGIALAAAGRGDEAVTAFAEAVRLNPNVAEARLNYGLALLASGRAAEAESQIRRGVELKQDAAPLHAALGDALAQQGKRAEAEASFRRALTLAPEHPDALAGLAALRTRQDRHR